MKFLTDTEIKAIEVGIRFYAGETIQGSELPDMWPLPETVEAEFQIISSEIKNDNEAQERKGKIHKA